LKWINEIIKSMFYISILFLVFIDLFTKSLAKENLLAQKNLIGDFFYLKYAENIWIAFSIQITWMFLKILTVIIIWIIFWYYLTEEKIKNNKIINLSFIFILWWALWNAYERIFNGKVIDFLWIKYFSIFNFADIFITIWVVIYLWSYILFKKQTNYEVWK